MLQDWPYVEGVLWGSEVQMPLVTRIRDSSSVLFGLYEPSCYGWAAKGMLVGGAGPSLAGCDALL